jgi:hypothetical protein
MTTNGQVTDRYAEAAPNGRMLRPKGTSVYVSDDGHTIYSYGYHFPMAQIMPSGDEPRGWWLVNGDRYSKTTNRHQSDLRSALARTGLPMLIVPFSALDRAGIQKSSIQPVVIDPDGWQTVTRRGPASEMPRYVYDFRDLGDGMREWDTRVHHLGGAVFTASYRVWDHRETASFLSAFDDQEGFGLYFLAQLPDGAAPATVAEAFDALRPAEVREADAAGLPVVRQGDVFAIPVELTTRGLPGPSVPHAYVLGVNHVATEVRELDGATYARGTLRHRPLWRRPEHRMQKLGGGWHRLVRNTVPDGRSWSIDGKVD